MSAWIAWRSSCAAAGAGALIAQANSKAAKSLVRMVRASSVRDELDHVEQGFEMGARQDETPATLADPLELTDHIPFAVAAVAIGERLIAELQRAEEDHSAAGVGKERSDRPLRP